MKTFTPASVRGLVVIAALSTAGCSSGISSRIQEKSEVYSELTPTVQKNLREGTIEPGYTADMVYMALGHPSAVKVKDSSRGKIGIWVYRNFYPEGYATAPVTPRFKTGTSADAIATPATLSDSNGGKFAVKRDAANKVQVPEAGSLASDEADALVPATSSFVNVGSSDYGYAKYEIPEPSYTATDRRGWKPYQANASTFSARSAAMEALDVPDMDSASLYVIFYKGRVAQMKLAKN
jgi:hypothetical protein